METTIKSESEKKLDPEFKKKWVEALRSGEYKQNRNCSMVGCDSQYNPTYCCLAVAGKVVGMTDAQVRNGYDNMPDPVINGGFSNPIAVKLIDMNDGGYGFNQIAAYIEANL